MGTRGLALFTLLVILNLKGEGSMLYKGAKFIHLAGLVLWLGPSTGAYMLIIFARAGEQSSIELWLLEEYLKLIYLELFGFVLLIISGTTMRLSSPPLAHAYWLRLKLFIVFLFFVPVEAAQLLIYQLVVKKAFVTGNSIPEAVRLFDNFSIAIIAPLAAAIAAVFLLAIFKPERGFLRRKSPGGPGTEGR